VLNLFTAIPDVNETKSGRRALQEMPELGKLVEILFLTMTIG
jgi:hypothetical protein